MQVFAFVAATLWVIGFLVLGSWAFYLSIKMETCRIANETGISWRGSKFAFQKKASDYTETGQMYRQSASKIAILANPGNPILPTAEAHADAALMMTIGRVDRFVMGLGEIGHSGGRLQRPDNTSASALRSPVGCVTTPPQTQD